MNADKLREIQLRDSGLRIPLSQEGLDRRALITEVMRLREGLHRIAITGGSSDLQINASCHLHIECADMARDLLEGEEP